MKSLVPICVLFFLSPLLGEYLLGNLKISELGLLPFLALLYGTGAIAVRETARRLGRGYGTMLGLAVAYAIVEEGLVDQMLFNPDYFPGQAEAMQTMIPGLGVDLWLLLIVTAMHAIWSILIPIILTESVFCRDRTAPWLGPIGYRLSLLAFLAGAAGLTWLIWQDSGFKAAPHQLATAALVSVLVAAATLWMPGHMAGPKGPARVAPPLGLAVGAFVLSSLFMLTDELTGWSRVLGCLAIGLTGGRYMAHQGQSDSWTHRHTLAITGGLLATYSWLGAVMTPETGPKAPVDHLGTVLLVVLVLTLWVLAWRGTTAPMGRQDPD